MASQATPVAVRRHPARRSLRRTLSAAVAVPLTVTLLAFSLGGLPAAAAEAPILLRTSADFGVLAAETVTNTGPSVIHQDLGLHPGTAVVGFPPGAVNGAVHQTNAVALQAKEDLVAAYNDAAGRGPGAAAGELGGRTVVGGVYTGATLGLTGTLTLDAQGDPNTVFIFQSASTLVTASNSVVSLINGAHACNVFWQVGSSVTLGTGTRFVGTAMALTSIAAQTGATVDGRLLARNGEVTLDTNVIRASACSTATAAPTATPTATPAPSGEPDPTGDPSATGQPTSTGEPTASGEPTATATTTSTATATSPTVTSSATTSAPGTMSSPGGPTRPDGRDSSTRGRGTGPGRPGLPGTGV